jgi:hypothetical protein
MGLTCLICTWRRTCGMIDEERAVGKGKSWEHGAPCGHVVAAGTDTRVHFGNVPDILGILAPNVLWHPSCVPFHHHHRPPTSGTRQESFRAPQAKLSELAYIPSHENRKKTSDDQIIFDSFNALSDIYVMSVRRLPAMVGNNLSVSISRRT